MNKIKSDRNIFPWVLSVIPFLMSVFALVFFNYRNFVGLIFGAMDKSWFDIMFFYFLVALVLGVSSLIFGIKRRKEVGRLSGALGIIIPAVVVLLTIFSAIGVGLSIIFTTT